MSFLVLVYFKNNKKNLLLKEKLELIDEQNENKGIIKKGKDKLLMTIPFFKRNQLAIEVSNVYKIDLLERHNKNQINIVMNDIVTFTDEYDSFLRKINE